MNLCNRIALIVLSVFMCADVVAATGYQPRIIVHWYKEVNDRFHRGTEFASQRITSPIQGSRAACKAAIRVIERYELPALGINEYTLIKKTTYCLPVEYNEDLMVE